MITSNGLILGSYFATYAYYSAALAKIVFHEKFPLHFCLSKESIASCQLDLPEIVLILISRLLR